MKRRNQHEGSWGESVIKIGFEYCPHCHETEIYTSRSRSIWEDLIILLLLRPVRCRGCEDRFYRPLWLPTPRYPSARNV